MYGCANAGAVKCWGSMEGGPSATNNAQSKVTNLGPVSQLAAQSQGFHTCVILSNGAGLSCWGDGDSGQTNINPPGVDPRTIKQLAVGGFHTCALDSSGGVHCWGRNSAGQTSVPPGLGPVAMVTAGSQHTCVILINGNSVQCWGADDYGQSMVPSGLTALAPTIGMYGSSV